ncbi:hypothetical protein ACHHYP_04051 [Achlya hypogyna]|uniref:Secreted protein n=1 Tax=Achlya hypogyna TaxID=1202772 RepID=A0A0A7CN97_ACHHY|nr:secreted protein [Achlya hypogyna]OQR92119.1 hypothetical protein ACHHYP_04051 [Achlya hypogyna]
MLPTRPLLIGVTAAAIALLLAPTSYAPTTATHFPAHAPLHTTAPPALWGDGRYAFGRYKAAVDNLLFHSEQPTSGLAHFPARLQTKHWHYSSVDAGPIFVALAFVQLQYVADIFLYVVDKKSGTKFEFTDRLFGGFGLTFAASSIDAAQCTRYRDAVSACFDGTAWRLQADVAVVSHAGEVRPLELDVAIAGDGEALTLLYPLADDPLRPAYVHKAAGAAARGVVTLGDEAHAVTRGLGAIDWTKSMALRQTSWHWASASFLDADNVTAVGINLSKLVYDVDGASQENALWVDGRVCPLGGVAFAIPADKSARWRITSTAPSATDAVELTFTPAGARADDAGVPFVIESRFVQPYGTFNGRVVCSTQDGNGTTVVHTIDVVDAFGVVEDHFALW